MLKVLVLIVKKKPWKRQGK